MNVGLFSPLGLIHTTRGRALILGLAALTMAVEMASLLMGTSVRIGSFPLSVSILPAMVLLAALGSSASGRAGDRDRLVPFWIAMGAGLALGLALFSRTGDGWDMAALLVAAANEEVVYRFAVPLVITSALMVVRFPSHPARIVGYVVGGTWWVLLPGHQAQTDGLGALLTYGSFAVIGALVVARSRALIPMSVAHCVLNVITISYLRGDLSAAGRGAMSAALLFLLLGTFAWPGDARPAADGTPADPADQDLITDTVIDLRDGHRPAVHRGDHVTYLDAPDDEPAAVTTAEPPDGPPGPGSGPRPD